jgi:hypothetical protein
MGLQPVGTLTSGSRYRGTKSSVNERFRETDRDMGRRKKKPHPCEAARRGHHSPNNRLPVRSNLLH